MTKAEEKVIVHGCNAHGVMGSGVALAIREKWPQAYQDYHTQWYSDIKGGREHMTLGSIVPCVIGDKIIINAITQKDYGKDGKKYVSYDAIDDAMRLVLRFCNKNYIRTVAMPMIGAGLGGGNWKVIETIISESLAGYIDVTVYKV